MRSRVELSETVLLNVFSYGRIFWWFLMTTSRLSRLCLMYALQLLQFDRNGSDSKVLCSCRAWLWFVPVLWSDLSFVCAWLPFANCIFPSFQEICMEHFCCIRILHEQPLLGNWSQRQSVWDIDTWYGMSRHEPQLSLAVCRIQSNIAWSHDSTLLVTVPKDGIHVINQLKQIHHKWYKLIMSVGFIIWYQVWKILYTVIY